MDVILLLVHELVQLTIFTVLISIVVLLIRGEAADSELFIDRLTFLSLDFLEKWFLLFLLLLHLSEASKFGVFL